MSGASDVPVTREPVADARGPRADEPRAYAQHTIVALMQDRPGVLHRAVSLLRRRGYNIESLAVGRSETPGVSRMTLVVEAEDVEQVVKQLYRLIEVLKVNDVTNSPTVERETALLKLHAPAAKRAGIMAVTNAFGAKVVDVGPTTVVVELTATSRKVDSFIEVVRAFGLKELMRTGRIAMVRGTPGSDGARPSGSPPADFPAAGEPAPGSWIRQADGAS